jgi:hypothetical protein
MGYKHIKYKYVVLRELDLLPGENETKYITKYFSTVPDAADYIGCSAPTVMKLIRGGKSIYRGRYRVEKLAEPIPIRQSVEVPDTEIFTENELSGLA